MLDRVRIADPQERVKQYPHQLSGGMRQRVMIALALSCNPSILIADEPTTALDVTIQAQIIDLMEKLQEDFGSSIIIITHNLGVVSQMADYVAVMYFGRIVEYGSDGDGYLPQSAASLYGRIAGIDPGIGAAQGDSSAD